jgi:type IV pilus assembly protein PilV
MLTKMRYLKYILKKENGFSLIEVMISLVILAIGLLAIAALQITSVKGNLFSDNITQASIIGQDLLERLKDLPLNDPHLTDGPHTPDSSLNGSSISVRGISFSKTYTVGTDPGIPANSRVITVTVTWMDTASHTISFLTVKSP